MSYYVVCVSEDGYISFEEYEPEVLEHRLTERWWGDVNILTAAPAAIDPNYWPGVSSMLIIKGEIVVPHEERVVVGFKLP